MTDTPKAWIGGVLMLSRGCVPGNRLAAAAAASLLVPGHAPGHHSISPYDTQSVQELQGRVSAIRWRNPHIGLTVQVDGEAWEVEGDSANAAVRQGLSRDSIQVGDEIRIAGWPSTRGRRELFLTNMLLDGTEIVVMDLDLPLRFSGPPRARAADAAVTAADAGMARVWSSSGELYRLRSPYVLTPAAQAARAGWEPLTDMLALQCIAPGMPNAMLNPYPIEIVEMAGEMLIRIEEWEAVRTIHMTGTIPAEAPRTPLGYSIGRWEGDRTLVVETARVDFPYLDDAGTPMSAEVRMLERFTLSADGGRLDYEISVTDPDNLVEPAVWEAAWVWVPGTVIRPFECEPE